MTRLEALLHEREGEVASLREEHETADAVWEDAMIKQGEEATETERRLTETIRQLRSENASKDVEIQR